MAANQLLDFADIIAMVREEIKYQASDTVTEDRVKRDINAVYLDEVVPFKRWLWLAGHTDVQHKAYYGTGTAAVTNGSLTVTLSTTLTSSRTGFFFALDGYQEIYTIANHMANSDSLQLSSPFTGTTDAAANFKIWTDTIPMPQDCRETVEIWHDYRRPVLEALGIQEFRRRVLETPRLEVKPVYYAPYDYFDPTPLTGETESDRYRVIKVHPSLTVDTITLHVDYVKEVTALDADGDEPAMALEDRIVLVYGALARAWGRARNEERASMNQQLFDRKLAAMASRLEDGFDKPQLTLDSLYITKKRGRHIRRLIRR